MKNAQSYLLPLSGNQIRAGDYICTPTTSCEPCSIDNVRSSFTLFFVCFSLTPSSSHYFQLQLNHPSCQPYGNRRALSCIPSPIQQILSTEIIPGSLPPPRHPGAPPGIGSNPGIVNSPVNGAIIPAAVVVGGALAVVPPIGNVAGGSGKPIPNVNGGGGIDWPVPKEGILGTNPLESGNGGNAGGGIGKIVGSNNNNNNALGEKGSHLVGGENGKIIADSASGKVPPEGETGATNEEVAFKESLRLEAIQDAETVSKDFGTSSSGRKVGNGALSSGGNGGSSNEGEEENELWSDDRKRMLWRRAEVGGTGGSSGAIDEVYTWEACPKVVSKERADFHEFVVSFRYFFFRFD